MKNIFIAIIVIALVVLFGTFPLSLLAKLFSFLGRILDRIAKFLNLFGWNGIL